VRVDGPRAVWTAYARMFDHQTLYSTTTFKRSWRPRHYEMTGASNVSQIWHQLMFLFVSLSSFSFHWIQQWPLWFLLPLHLIHVFFITVFFLFWISYEITNIFQFHPILFFNLLGFVLILLITIFFPFNRL
jgi:hypothetical protein